MSNKTEFKNIVLLSHLHCHSLKVRSFYMTDGVKPGGFVQSAFKE